MVNDNITLHQCLHGYSSGHRLISTSIELDREPQKLMLDLSDISGTPVDSNFNNCITGYPLPNEQFYVIAKTWYAKEMERPGCVWTHSLVIPTKHLSEITDAEILINTFIRPASAKSFNIYSKQLSIKQNELSQNNLVYNSASESNEQIEILNNLYNPNEESHVVFPGNSSKRYEQFFVNIWIQQWPKLKSKFKFCTGALSLRRWYDEHFDLQVTHRKCLPMFKKSNKISIIYDDRKKIGMYAPDNFINFFLKKYLFV